MLTTSMKSSTRISLTIAGLAIVSACGNAETALGPATTSQTVSGALTLTETGTFTANGVVVPDLAASVDPDITGTTFSFYRDGTGNTPARFFGQTSSVYAGVYATDTDTAASTQGAIAGRIGTTDIRAGGFATYTGEYRGIITEEDVAGGGDYDDIDYFVTGDATLNANFITGTIGGSITSRELVRESLSPSPSDTVSDITLATDTYDSNGLFGASIGGATLNDSGTVFTGGTASYSGVIAGSNSQEVAGTTSILYTAAGDRGYAETGVFIATE